MIEESKEKSRSTAILLVAINVRERTPPKKKFLVGYAYEYECHKHCTTDDTCATIIMSCHFTLM